MSDSHENVAVVTGGANGIGRVIASEFTRRGFTVVIADPADNANEVAGDLSEGAGGGTALAVPTDVSDAGEVEDLFAVVGEEFGRLDVLVNNAGVFQTAEPTTDQSVSEWQRVMDVHLRGAYLCSKFAAPIMLEQDRAAIVNISSVAALGAFPYRTAYGPAKSAINMLTRVLAVEWAADGLRVNAVAPGYINTDRNESRIRSGELDPEPLRDRTPMGELGDPGDIADAVAFLASDEAEYVTGVVLPVDGGWSAYGHV